MTLLIPCTDERFRFKHTYAEEAEKRASLPDTPEFWTAHCWFARYNGMPCAEPAKWRGPLSVKTRNPDWRACNEHKIDDDVVLQ